MATAAHNLKFDNAQLRRDMIARAETLGVRLAADAADAAGDARVVTSAVTGRLGPRLTPSGRRRGM